MPVLYLPSGKRLNIETTLNCAANKISTKTPLQKIAVEIVRTHREANLFCL